MSRKGKNVCLLWLCVLITVGTLPLAAKTIKVGFFAFDGYHMIDEDGRKSGYGYDFLQYVARETGWDYEYIGYGSSWADMLTMLEEGKIDILTSARWTEEREQKFARCESAIGTSQALLSTRYREAHFVSGDYQSYNGMNIGLILFTGIYPSRLLLINYSY